MNTIRNLLSSIYSISVFRQTCKTPLFEAFVAVLQCAFINEHSGFTHTNDDFAQEKASSLFLSLLCAENVSWQEAVYALVVADENPFTLALEKGENPSVLLSNLAQNDIGIFLQCAKYNFLPHIYISNSLFCENPLLQKAQIASFIQSSENCFTFDTLCYLWKKGAGLLRVHHAFIWEKNALRPVLEHDTILPTDLSGYEPQRSLVMENTARFVQGFRANNMLLYGDRGTGKSATVKAVARFFAPQGLRIIEVQKKDLLQFSDMIHTLRTRGFRFIIFVDDLSFERADETYTALKALLEGGLETRAENMLLYATSNRRHLVAETNESHSVRAEDTVQEQLSLSDRFGITVIFSTPLQDEYLHIVKKLIAQKHLSVDIDKACSDALKWEKWYNGRSPRTAVHFVEWLAGGEKLPWSQ